MNAPTPGFTWTEERVEQLKSLHGQGISFGTIARLIGGFSRCACIGKARRLGLVLRKKAEWKQAGRTDYRKKRITARRDGPPQITDGFEATELPADQPDNPTTIYELTCDNCHWPCSGVGAETVFCGGHAIKGKHYCARHCSIAYQKPSSRTQSRAQLEITQRKKRISLRAQALSA